MLKKQRLSKLILLCLFCAAMLVWPAGAGRPADAVYAESAEDSGESASVKQAKKVRLNRQKAYIRTDSSCKLKVSNTSRKVKWSVKNPKVARIETINDRAVMVYGKNRGKTVITAKVGSKKLTCTVFVQDPQKPRLEYVSWKKGKWTGDCYYDSTGTQVVDLNAMLKKRAPSRSYLQRYPYLYIGASRTGNTESAVRDPKTYFYACGGATFKWFFVAANKDYGYMVPALQFIRSYLAQRPKGTVIIDMGGNDLKNIDTYIGFYKSLIKAFPSAKFRFMGILPRAKGNPSNSSRKAFDTKLQKAFPGKVINLYDKVYKMPGFSTVDGVHYGKVQSRKIYEMTMRALGRKVRVDINTGKVTG